MKRLPSEGVLKIKSLEAFTAAADGRATKIIIPSELQGIAGLAAGIRAVAEKDDGSRTEGTAARSR